MRLSNSWWIKSRDTEEKVKESDLNLKMVGEDTWDRLENHQVRLKIVWDVYYIIRELNKTNSKGELTYILIVKSMKNLNLYLLSPPTFSCLGFLTTTVIIAMKNRKMGFFLLIKIVKPVKVKNKIFLKIILNCLLCISDEQSRIFNHKGGLMPQGGGERYNINHHHQSSKNYYYEGWA